MQTELITRIAAGQGENAEVLTAMGFVDVGYNSWVREDDAGNIVQRYKGKPLTSVDDALRLVLPADRVMIDQHDHGWDVVILHETPVEWQRCEGSAPTAARALTIAILRTRETTNDHD